VTTGGQNGQCGKPVSLKNSKKIVERNFSTVKIVPKISKLFQKNEK